MNKLEVLCIDNTDIDSGLEYLPENIKFGCLTDLNNPKCKAIKEKLKKHKQFYDVGKGDDTASLKR